MKKKESEGVCVIPRSAGDLQMRSGETFSYLSRLPAFCEIFAHEHNLKHCETISEKRKMGK